MERVILMLAMLSMAFLALANPIEPIYMSRFWFDNDGYLNVLYSNHIYQSSEIDLFDGTNHFTRTINPDNPSTFTQVYPDANCSAQLGYLMANYIFDPPYGITDEVTWGTGLTIDLSPLLPGQCGQQFYLEDYENTDKVWAKDLLSNPGSIYGPNATCDLNIFCHNEAGAPVEGVPIHLYGHYFPSGYSGTDGWYHADVPCVRLNVVAKGPVSSNVIFNDTFFVEPGQSYTLDVVVNSSGTDDNSDMSVPGRLTAYPNVLRSSQTASLHLEYEEKVVSDAYYALYDLKGREIATKEYTGETSTWQLPTLSSGVYFISLKEKNRILDTQKLIILR